MVEFKIPAISNNAKGWGPPPADEAPPLGICDFVDHLDKFPLTRLGKIVDFTASGQRYMNERGKGKNGKGFGKGKAQPLQPKEKEDDFTLVDHNPLPGKSSGRGRGGPFGRSKGRGKGIATNYQEGILGQRQRPTYANSNQQKGGKGKSKGGNQRRGLPSFKEWSVMTKTGWPVKRDIQLSSLARLQIDSKQVEIEDLFWCGKLHNYNKAFDRITVKTEQKIRKFEDLNFFSVTTTEDPHLPELVQNDPTATVIATDHVLACLIAAARSVYSWDIVITKIGGKIMFDKRDGSQVDFLSVNETSGDPPNTDDKDSNNTPVKLGQEASCINQNFSQMVLDDDTPAEKMERENPFSEYEDDNTVASGAYRYRKFTLPGNPKAETDYEQQPVSIITRTEVNCKIDGPRGGLASVKALNEFDPKINKPWRTHLESQGAACLATELKNNAFKLGRWTAQALLAGCDVMKIGYVSRVTPSNPWNHTVLSVQTYLTDGFAQQLGLSRDNMFGILRSIIDLVMGWDDGKYLLLKDPTKSMMRIHEVPWDTFGDEDEGEGDGEEEEEVERDEDGNVAPPQPTTPAASKLMS